MSTSIIPFCRTSRTLAIGALLAAIGAGAAQAQTRTADPPLRISIGLQEGVERLESRIGNMIFNGVASHFRRHGLKSVKPGEAADVSVTVSRRTVTIPPHQGINKKGEPTLLPAQVFEYLWTVFDGREFKMEAVAILGPPRWGEAAFNLGGQIGTVLKARTATATAVADVAAIAHLIAKLDTKDHAQKAAAADAIARLGTAGATAASALVEILTDDRLLVMVGPGTRTTAGEVAARALVAIGAADQLRQFVSSKADGTARRKALFALAMANLAGTELVTNALVDRSPRVRSIAAFIAPRVLGKKAIPRLVEMVIGDRDSIVREVSRDSLVKLSGQDFGLDRGKWRAWWAATQGQ